MRGPKEAHGAQGARSLQGARGGLSTSSPGESEWASVAELLRRWLKASGARRRVDDDAIFEKWGALVGEELASHTRVVDVQSGELVVEVDSAPLLQELATYSSGEILEAVRRREEFQWVHGIRFRAGAFER